MGSETTFNNANSTPNAASWKKKEPGLKKDLSRLNLSLKQGMTKGRRTLDKRTAYEPWRGLSYMDAHGEPREGEGGKNSGMQTRT